MFSARSLILGPVPGSEGQLRESMEGRLRELRRAVAELEALLGERPSATGTSGAGVAPTKPRSGRRAPYGSNREQILAAIRERPGIKVGEIASQTKINPRVVTATVYRLKGQGELERDEDDGLRLPADKP